MEQQKTEQVIIVLIDGSEDSWRALRQALFLAQKMAGTRIRAIYPILPRLLRLPRAYLANSEVVEVREPAPNTSLRQVYREWGREVLARAKHRGEQKGISVTADIREGRWLHILQEEAAKGDLVVFGNTGIIQKSPFSHLKGDRIANGIGLPVLIVTSYARHPQYLAVAYDGHPSAEGALRYALERAEQWHVPLSVIIVNSPSVSATKGEVEASLLLKEYSVKGDILVQYGPVARTIIDAATSVNADILVVGMYRHSWLRRALTGSNFHRVLELSPIPVLIVPPRRMA